MSEENIKLIRAGYEHFNRTGEPPWEFLDPEAEFDASAIAGFGALKGRDDIVAAMREFSAAFEQWRIEPQELKASGDKVFVAVRDGGRLKDTGDEIYNRFFHVWTIRSGRVVAWNTFTDRAKALEMAGLPSE